MLPLRHIFSVTESSLFAVLTCQYGHRFVTLPKAESIILNLR